MLELLHLLPGRRSCCSDVGASPGSPSAAHAFNPSLGHFLWFKVKEKKAVQEISKLKTQSFFLGLQMELLPP